VEERACYVLRAALRHPEQALAGEIDLIDKW
jgi:hypothetical protein